MLAVVTAGAVGTTAVARAEDPETPSQTSADRVIREDLPLNFQDPRERAVQRSKLSPLTPETSDLDQSSEQSQDVSGAVLRKHLERVRLPPVSPTLFKIWKQWLTSAKSDEGRRLPGRAERAKVLEQSGLPEEALRLSGETGLATRRDPAEVLDLARLEAGLGNTDRACRMVASIAQERRTLAAGHKMKAAALAGYCAAVNGDNIAASLQASLAHDLAAHASKRELSVTFLDAVAAGLPFRLPADAPLDPLSFRLGSLAEPLPAEQVLAQATPALLSILANSAATPSDLKVRSAELAAAQSIVSPQALAAIYRAPGAGGDARTIERAALFKQVEAANDQLKRARLIRAFVDELTRVDLGWVARIMTVPPAAGLQPNPEIAWFGETAAEIGIASGDLYLVRRWAEFAKTNEAATRFGSLSHWLVLADIADPANKKTSTNLDEIQSLAAAGKFDPTTLHYVVTVLDALRMQVPIPLWELASRSPQPSDGHLPDTGVLSAVKVASEKREVGRTLLLVMEALGPKGAAGAHLIALGDSIRALIRVGMQAEARRLGIEALFDRWPRTFAF